jgi:hypothetical protein
MVLLHAWKVTFGTILSEMGQYKTFFRNIKVTKTDKIWCYYMLEKCDFRDNTVQNETIKDFLWKYKGD